MNMQLLLLLCIGNIYINVAAYQEHFRTIYQWRYFDYKWKNASHKAAAIATGDYNYTQCVIIDADYSKGESRYKLFMLRYYLQRYIFDKSNSRRINNLYRLSPLYNNYFIYLLFFYISLTFFYISLIFLTDGRVFVTIIRNNGVPSSLNVVSKHKGPGGPLLQPYPDWTWTKRGDCNGITNAFRIAVNLFCVEFFILLFF